MMKLKRDKLANFLRKFSPNFSLFTPSRSEGATAYNPWDGEDLDFLNWYRNTLRPPKALFFPSFEEMFRFQKEGGEYKLTFPPSHEKSFLLLGVRPCDARALKILDLLFEKDYPDPYWLPRREKAIIIGLGCKRPCETCFCPSFGIDPTDSQDVDLMANEVGDNFLIKEVSPKGKELLSQTDFLEPSSPSEEKGLEEEREGIRKRVKRRIEIEGLPERMREGFGDEALWERISRKCLSCGICTYLCPTCYCFDINDDIKRTEGVRIRSWDSCQFPIFTKMPVENPRKEKWRRFRQRYYHKFEYFWLNFGVIACSGCGRCIRHCPVNVDVTQIMGSLR